MNSHTLRTFYSNPWALGYVAFLTGFFVLPYEQGRLHKNGFAMFVILFSILSFSKINWRSFKEPLIIFTVLYLLYAALSIFWSSHYTNAYLVKYIALAISTIVFCFIPSYLKTVTHLSAKDLVFLIFIVLFPIAVLSTIYSALSFYQLHSIDQRLIFFGRLDGPITHSVVNALLILVSIGLIKQINNRWWYSGIIIGVAILVTGILLSQSRGPILALCIALPIQIFVLKMYRTLTLYLIFLGLGTFLLINNPVLTELVTSRGVSFRPEIWKLIWQSMPGHMYIGHSILPEQRFTLPILGEVHHPHNLIIASFYHLGVLGLVLHLGVIVMWIKYALSIQVQAFKAVSAGVFLYSFIHFQFDGGILLTKPDVLWWGVWLPISWVLVEQNQIKIFKDC